MFTECFCPPCVHSCLVPYTCFLSEYGSQEIVSIFYRSSARDAECIEQLIWWKASENGNLWLPPYFDTANYPVVLDLEALSEAKN